MVKPSMLASDRLDLRLAGPEPERFLTMAAARGIRLRRIRTCQKKEGECAATVCFQAEGVFWRDLAQLAQRGGWKLSKERRRGPGRLLEMPLRRPGLLVGAVCFAVTVKLLSGVVWCVNLGSAAPAAWPEIREILAQSGLREGSTVCEKKLEDAQQKLEAEQKEFGWLSLNFAGGCLYLESASASVQPVKELTQNQALYAKADALVLKLDIQSGFALVEPQQMVENGQLLVDANRSARSGDAVPQSASGRVIARVKKTYVATRPLCVSTKVATGAGSQKTMVALFGKTIWEQEQVWNADGTAAKERTKTVQNAPIFSDTEYVPLCIGPLALPGWKIVCTRWAVREQNQEFSLSAAQALARRDCMLSLLKEFPDAKIRALQVEFVPMGEEPHNQVHCRMQATFDADIAQATQAPEYVRPAPEA